MGVRVSGGWGGVEFPRYRGFPTTSRRELALPVVCTPREAPAIIDTLGILPPSDPRSLLQLVHAVGLLPRELGELATEVAVRRGLGVDRAEQVEVLDDRGGAEVEH